MKQKCTPKRQSKNDKGKGKNKVPTVHIVTVLPNLPKKKSDPGAPIVECLIGENTYRNVLLDDGASVNFLPASIVESSNLGEVKSTSMTLEFANRCFKHPRGSWRML